MSITSAFAIYFVLWWLTLFLVLPFGIRSQGEAGEHVPGSDIGAPVVSRMARRLVWNTVLSVVLFGIGMLAYRAGYLNLDMLSRMMGIPI